MSLTGSRLTLSLYMAIAGGQVAIHYGSGVAALIGNSETINNQTTPLLNIFRTYSTEDGITFRSNGNRGVNFTNCKNL